MDGKMGKKKLLRSTKISMFAIISILLIIVIEHHVKHANTAQAEEATENSEANAVDVIDDLDQYPFTSEGILLMDANTGAVLYEKNAEETYFPASITKIVTALLALEEDELDASVVTSEKARHAEGNRIYLEEGEETPLIDLVYALMLNSGNDAAIAIAEHIAGNVEQFAHLMNEKAEELGAENTNFVNPHGLHDDDHYTTPMDMARIAQSALKNPEFREIIMTETMSWDGEAWQSSLVNLNNMLNEYDGMTGMKTGYTSKAQQTYVGSAERDGTELIVVLMGADQRNNVWAETEVLLDHGFHYYKTEKIRRAGEEVNVTLHGEEYELVLQDDLFVTVDQNMDMVQLEEELTIKDLPLFHPSLQAGSPFGEFAVKHEEEILGSTPLLLTEPVSPSRPVVEQFIDEHYQVAESQPLVSFFTSKWLWGTVAVLFLFSSFVLLLKVIKSRRERKKGLSFYKRSNHWPPSPTYNPYLKY